ncbi:MAG: polysaccharide biosynthesis tyrosine autokinase [Pelatocladus maniniholoensis HA4357-MV3]|jgi:capsular exopolysaccharide synthesis family protein|uniref:Polysaccharide biosynthesis tyrosine autokinase n=1 Tax=Pelatocladus maniniholoensis HA4357-MV3 TaxID=1117104 RepID=A0A9E3LUT8_9NOST|nr:polysaccharide biosynthesis tyrosine autokinase [Pelatocladus maniniholoensis HA4357-MV3]
MKESEYQLEEIDVQKYLLVLQRRWMTAVGVFGAVVTLALLYAFSLKPTYTAQASLLIKTNRASSLTGLGEDIGRLESLVRENSPVDTQAKIVISVPVIQETITSLSLKNDEGEPLTVEELLENLKVEGVKGTDVLEISYTNENPQLAAKVINKVVDTYIKQNIQANREEATSAGRFILQQLPKTEEAVQKAELALRRFKEKNKVIVLQEEATAAVNTISKLEDEIAQAQAQLVDANARLEKLQNQARVNSQEAVSAVDLSQVAGTQQVLKELQEAQTELTVARTRYLPGHPTVSNLEEKVSALKNLLQQRVEQVGGNNPQISTANLQMGEVRQKLIEDLANTDKERAGLEKRLADLRNTWSLYKQRANIMPRLEQTQRELERKLKAAQTTYETLLTRLQEINVAENQNIGNARIISPALVPDEPSGTRKALIVLGGGVLGILLGIIAALTSDLIDRSIKTVREARELFQYTLLGVIPSVSRSDKSSYSVEGLDRPVPRVVGRDIPHFPVGDAYQMLQANLKFLSDKQLKAITVTSSIPKEGKSEVSANLAVAMAEVERRVLLVDADMRHPIQHHIWQLSNKKGLSNIIVDQVPLESVVHEVMPNLHVLTSGVIPPNPVALLDSDRMATLVANFTKDYDCVIFDAPPLAGTADAAVLGKLADGILLVVRPEVVDFASASAAKEFLTQSGQKVLGMVINAVSVKRERDSYFYYGKNSVESTSVSKKSILVKNR